MCRLYVGNSTHYRRVGRSLGRSQTLGRERADTSSWEAATDVSWRSCGSSSTSCFASSARTEDMAIPHWATQRARQKEDEERLASPAGCLAHDPTRAGLRDCFIRQSASHPHASLAKRVPYPTEAFSSKPIVLPEGWQIFCGGIGWNASRTIYGSHPGSYKIPPGREAGRAAKSPGRTLGVPPTPDARILNTGGCLAARSGVRARA
jgi:hypothetical protein